MESSVCQSFYTSVLSLSLTDLSFVFEYRWNDVLDTLIKKGLLTVDVKLDWLSFYVKIC